MERDFVLQLKDHQGGHQGLKGECLQDPFNSDADPDPESLIRILDPGSTLKTKWIQVIIQKSKILIDLSLKNKRFT